MLTCMFSQVRTYDSRTDMVNREPKGPKGLYAEVVGAPEKRRLSAIMRERGASYAEIADAHWNGKRSTAWQQVQKWYADHPAEGAAMHREVALGKLDQLEVEVRKVMAKKHVAISAKGTIVYDEEGNVLEDDEPFFKGVDRLLALLDRRIKLVPGLAAPKVTSEMPNEELERQIKEERAKLGRLLGEAQDDEA